MYILKGNLLGIIVYITKKKNRTCELQKAKHENNCDESKFKREFAHLEFQSFYKLSPRKYLDLKPTGVSQMTYAI